MAAAKIIEITSSSEKGFEDAIRAGIKRASESVDNIEGAWVKEQKVVVENNEVKEFRVDMKVTFLLKGS